jgi:segregation and condensation protein B
MTKTNIVRNVEAILFAGSKRMTAEEIGELLLESNVPAIIKALEQLKVELAEKDTALTLLVDGETWKLSLKDQYLGFTEKLMPTTELSKPVVETLAIIAWKSPIEQSEIVRLRSAAVYDHIAELFKLNLVTKTKKGRTYVLRVTDKFYEYFDMPQANVDEMLCQYVEPTAEEIKEETEFNKGDTFDETNEQHDKRLMEEIKSNTIDPEAIIRADKEFLNDFDGRLKDIESRSMDAGEALQSVDSSLGEDVMNVTGEIPSVDDTELLNNADFSELEKEGPLDDVSEEILESSSDVRDSNNNSEQKKEAGELDDNKKENSD